MRVKHAEMEETMKTLEAIAARNTCRAYKNEQISEDDLKKILSAANAAPNAAPHGTPAFSSVFLSIIQDPVLIKKIDDAQPDIFPTHGAPTIIVVSCAKLNGNETDLTLANAVCIVENMFLAATELELGGALLFGVSRAVREDAQLCRELGIPEDFVPNVMFAVGIPTEKAPARDLTTDKIASIRL